MIKYITYLLILCSGAALGEGRVNNLCQIERVKNIEIVNLPYNIETQVSVDEEMLSTNFKYRLIVNNVDKNQSAEIIDLLQMEYHEQERSSDLRWRFSVTSENNNKCDIYFDGFGLCGKVNGINVCFSHNEISAWIMKKYNVFEQD